MIRSIIFSVMVAIPLLAVSQGQMEDVTELDWWQETIFYQIYPRSFMDSDGDGIGDLNGITTRLEHLKDLGIGATWLSPIFKSPMYDFGYDISDFYAIQDEYGTMGDFEKLIERANKLDIKIILDFVPNHASTESMWFKEALNGNPKYLEYFVWADGRVDENGIMQPPNNWISVFRKSAWEYRNEVGKYYLHQFVIGQPDLNYRNPELLEEMKNVMRFWLNKGVSGFRVDAVNFLFEVDKNLYGGQYPDEPESGYPGLGLDDYEYLDHSYTKNQNETLDMVYQWRGLLDEFMEKDNKSRVMMTEVYSNITDTIRYYGDSNHLGSHIPFNFGLITDVNGSSLATDIKFTIDRWMEYKPLNKPANWVLGNHDNKRVATRYGLDLVDGLNMIVLLLPGVGVTYMGEEIGMVDGEVSWKDTVDPAGCNTDDPINYWMVSRDPERTPFQWTTEKNAGFSTADKTWLPVADGYESLNVEFQKATDRSHYNVYRALSALRKQPAFRYGRYDSVALNNDVFAFRRWFNEETYVIVINMRNIDHQVDLRNFENVAGKLKVVVVSVQSPKNVGDTIEATSLHIKGNEAFVLTQNLN